VVLGGILWGNVDFLIHSKMFRGAHNLTLDAKGRLTMPVRCREELLLQCGGNLVVTVDRVRCLLMYPLAAWEIVQEAIMNLPSQFAETRELQRLMVGYATDLQLDAQGRVLLPSNLREFANLNRDCVMLGQGNKYELWDESGFKERRDAWLGSAPSGEMPPQLSTLKL
jgi:MraZ protein